MCVPTTFISSTKHAAYLRISDCTVLLVGTVAFSIVMSGKEEKPTLAGVTLKTRKRNIVIPVDPGSFASAVVQIVQDASEGLSNLDDILEAATKALENANNLEFSRYSDTLFEVFFAGGMVGAGGKLAGEPGAPKLDQNVLAAKDSRDGIMPYIKVFATLARRRPFLVRGLENTLIKLLLTTEFFDEENRRKIGIAMALVFSLKINVQPESIFTSCFNDRLVSKGTMLEVLTVFFQEFLSKDSMDDLVAILTKAKVVTRLMEFFPPQRRSPEEFDRHFTKHELPQVVEWNREQVLELKIAELKDSLTEQMMTDPPESPADMLAMLKAKKADGALPDNEILQVVWLSIMRSTNMTGKNQQQIFQGVVSKVKLYHKLLSSFASNGKLELALLITVQIHCYEDNRLLKIFSDILRLLYDAEIVGEDTIIHWYKKGSHPKGRNVFLKDAETFIKWLEEAEEEEEEDDTK
ncbi:hypothetical protein CEUSTIGMA_g1992.t1 [Chlamydomonas eustigma]|uniref:W2 domain-containing protein n=1 Tax=Chlamydomonas eustigma TaxID=1157962 RepID=A0A250WUN1_9CHLO|nr:hypothetical protein CEUSTIGMA_g1992.t1 [Chlamydomonas eustigma]|eukprot:GAX74543.1 hypothetical protein CEUSTIGMA_g1992.t1 [Chlamydomonas eustigma]